MLSVNIEKKLPSFNLKVDFKQNEGVLGFLGASGSGKSMSLKCISGLEKPTSGNIILNDKVFFDSEKKINLPCQKRKIGFLFQNYALFPNMTVLENIKIGLSKDQNISLCYDYIERLSLQNLEKHYPHQLSGGQQQRVALARALIIEPELLLLDEPFSALDNHLRLNMEKELSSIIKDYHGNVIFVTHDIAEAYRVCDNIIVYEKGVALENRDKNLLFKFPSNLAEATLTGCKNISKVKKINNNTIYAEDWGFDYKLGYEISDSVEYVGMRAHNIELMNNDEDINTYSFKVENIIENPFDFNIYVKSTNQESNSIINFFLDKSKVVFSKDDIIFIKFPEDSLFCF